MSVQPDHSDFVIPASFDDDSADFVIPIAAEFADYLKIPRFHLNSIVISPNRPPEPAITFPCTKARLVRFSQWMRSWFGLGDG